MKFRITILVILFIFISCKKETPANAGRISNNGEIEPENWMHQTLLKYNNQEISLTDLAVPGSHDAGMYVLNLCTFGANSCNTQTQFLPMKQQLEAGIRIFDLRPCKANGKYYVQHATSCDGLGCKGDLLSNIFTQTNNYLNTHAELVIMRFSHFCKTSYTDTNFMNLLTGTFGEKIYKETVISTIPFIQQDLKNIIPVTKSTGKVMLVFDEDVSNSAENKANGLFSGSILPTQGSWTNSHNFGDLKRRQLENFSNYNNDGNSLFSFSWQVTQDELMAINCVINSNAPSIQTNATIANNALSSTIDTLIMNTQIKKGRIPNIIWVDYADEFITKECIQLNKISLE